MINACNILIPKSEDKRPLGRPRRKWEDNIRIDLRETGWEGVDWMDLAQSRDQWRVLVNVVMTILIRLAYCGILILKYSC
jgi:hypothetical protein